MIKNCQESLNTAKWNVFRGQTKNGQVSEKDMKEQKRNLNGFGLERRLISMKSFWIGE